MTYGKLPLGATYWLTDGHGKVHGPFEYGYPHRRSKTTVFTSAAAAARRAASERALHVPRQRANNPAVSALAQMGISMARDEYARLAKLPLAQRKAVLQRRMASAPLVGGPTAWGMRKLAKSDRAITAAAKLIGDPHAEHAARQALRKNTARGITWDDERGIGAVPDAAQGDYFGFLRRMSAAEFLALNPTRDRPPSSWLQEQIRAGAALGRPFLRVVHEGYGWRVTGHEGRGRVQVLRDLYGPNVEIEVWIFPIGMRAHHLSAIDRTRSLLKDARPNSRRRAPRKNSEASFMARVYAEQAAFEAAVKVGDIVQWRTLINHKWKIVRGKVLARRGRTLTVLLPGGVLQEEIDVGNAGYPVE